MPAATPRSTVCVVILLLLSPVARTSASRDAAAAAAAPPNTMQGFLRYKVRGLSAVQGGFMSGSILMVAAGVGVQSAAVNFLRLLGGAAKLSGNPGMAQMHEFLRTGKGFDFSGAPVSAGYDVELTFTLVSDGKGDYRLKSGQASYSGSTDADLDLRGAGGNNHRITDRYRGQGTAALTPKNSSITLRTTGKGKERQVQFDVNVSFPVAQTGKSVWSSMGGITVISREENGDQVTWHMKSFGSENTETQPDSPPYAGVSYGRTAPPDSILRGRETWQDLTDSGVMVEWELWDECRADLESPAENDELVYDLGTPARIRRLAQADVQPSFWDQDLHWTFHEITGSDLEPRPDKADGNDFDFTYTRLPAKNSSFAYWDVEARFATERAKRAGCKNPKPRTVGYFFPREGDNNPGPSARAPEAAAGSGIDPNWFFYWRQTAAAQRRAAAIHYGGGSKWCTEGVGGYYSLGKSYIVVCDLATDWEFGFSHPFVDLVTDGIDTYAGVVLHEYGHHDDYKKWWPAGHSAVLDMDDDLIPDLLEPKVAVPAPLNGKHKFFDNDVNDTLGRGYDDEHYFAYMAMTDWKSGSADVEDWSCPGHQTFGDCK